MRLESSTPDHGPIAITARLPGARDPAAFPASAAPGRTIHLHLTNRNDYARAVVETKRQAGAGSAPIRVELVPHSPLWAGQANLAAGEVRQLLGPVCTAVHHVGSTSVPGVLAKPVIDLVATVTGLAALDAAQDALTGRGYRVWGEYGIAGRRYFSLDDPASGRRHVHLHGFEAGHPAAERMIAFCAYLRAHPEQARRYEQVKQACCARHPDNSTDYARAKDGWIRSLDAAVQAWWRPDEPFAQ